MSFHVVRFGAAALLGAGLMAGTAFAEVSGFLGNWLNSASASSGFLGSWMGSESDPSGIARLVVTQSGASHVKIHLFGRCKPTLCDWGAQLGRNHSADPGSDEVRSISADFNTGNAMRHLTLRPGPGGSLRFDVVTDFADNSGQHDYEASGTLSAAPVATAGEGSPGAPLAAAGAVLGAPGTSGEPVAQPGEAVEDCVAINPEDVYVAPSDRGWKVNDFNHTILSFGVNKVAAVRAEQVLNYYHFDEQCFIARPNAKMIYWRTAGQLPHAAMPGADCIGILPAKVQAQQIGDAWKVVEGDNALLDYGDDQTAAGQAASVIRTYRLNRQCFVARPDTTMVYWLSQ